MEIQLLIEFVALADKRHYSSVADDLFISQSSLSKHIKALERQLGAPLFIKSTRNVQLSNVGEGFYPYAKAIVENYHEGQKIISEFRSGHDQRLNITYPRSIYWYHTPELLAEFARLHPTCVINANTTDATFEEKLLSGSVDFAIIYEPLINYSGKALEIIPLHTDKLCIVLSESNHLAKYSRMSLANLAKEKYISPSEGFPTSLYSIVFQKYGIEPIKNIISSYNERIDLVRQNFGYSIELYMTIKSQNPPGIKAIDLDIPCNVNIVLAYSKDRKLTKLDKDFINITISFMKHIAGES